VTLSISKEERNREYKTYLKEVFENVYSTLQDTSEFGELDSYIEKVRSFNQNDTLSAVQKNIVTLLEIYAHLYYCQQLLLEKEGDKIFQKYLN